MARDVLTPIVIDWNGIEVQVAGTETLADATDGHQFLSAGGGKNMFLWLKNGDGSTHTATIQTPGVVDTDFLIAETVVVLLTLEEYFVSKFPANVYNQLGVDTVVSEPNYVFIDWDTVAAGVFNDIYHMPA